MDERQEPGTLEERVKRLEEENRQIRRELRYTLERVSRLWPEGGGKASQAVAPGPAPQPSALAVREGAEATTGGSAGVASGRAAGDDRRFRGPGDLGNLRSGEWWLNKVGIGLLLLGIAFLFMLAVERGWISPPVRVGFGLTVGSTLLALGLLVRERRPAFSQVLLGGGIGALYTSGFAAFQLYRLVPYPAAFAFMVGITLVAFALALRYGGVTLSLIGATGGLGTPFLLYTDSGTLGGLVLYTCLVLAGAGAVYVFRGWTSLLAVAFTGGWAVLAIGYANSISLFFDTRLSSDERLALQPGVTFAWLLFAFAPTIREFVESASTDDRLRVAGLAGSVSRALLVSGPLVALGFTQLIWEFARIELGWIVLSGAALYALAALAMRRTGRASTAYVHALVALLLLTLALVLMLREETLLFTLAAEAAALHVLSRRYSDRIVSAEAHLLSLVVAIWLSSRLLGNILEVTGGAQGPALLNARAALDLAVIATLLAASLAVLPRYLDLAYRVAAHVALLALLWRELSTLPDGEAWVTVAWGLYAVGLLAAGLGLDRVSLVRGGMATLFVTVGKLFLVDLSEVEATVRVVLFLGFGGLFLALSYYLQGLWRPETRESADGRSNASDGQP